MELFPGTFSETILERTLVRDRCTDLVYTNTCPDNSAKWSFDKLVRKSRWHNERRLQACFQNNVLGNFSNRGRFTLSKSFKEAYTDSHFDQSIHQHFDESILWSQKLWPYWSTSKKLESNDNFCWPQTPYSAEAFADSAIFYNLKIRLYLFIALVELILVNTDLYLHGTKLIVSKSDCQLKGRQNVRFHF